MGQLADLRGLDDRAALRDGVPGRRHPGDRDRPTSRRTSRTASRSPTRRSATSSRPRYPAAWARIEARRRFMADALGIELHPDVLPFSNIPAYLPPFLLRPDRAMTLAGLISGAPPLRLGNPKAPARVQQMHQATPGRLFLSRSALSVYLRQGFGCSPSMRGNSRGRTTRSRQLGRVRRRCMHSMQRLPQPLHPRYETHVEVVVGAASGRSPRADPLDREQTLRRARLAASERA